MPDERKPVICPWCGKEMRLWEDGNMAWFECMDCGAQTPTAFSDADDAPTDVMREAAYAAATRTPPNRPLTREQVEALDDLGAVWIVGETDVVLLSAGEARRTYGWLLNRLALYSRKPTPADIEAARKERNTDA